ncbi:MAG: CtkA family protein [Erysipelotrichaceae bacterium]|nr:CtkA family protein [Erysipelotrichaceae bacterium]
MFLYDFNQYEENMKLYGGNAGRKLGIVIDGENWLLKFPKTTRNLKTKVNLSYTTSPLSEYIGSHVYELLGYDVQKTLLGLKDGKLVVACKDFTDSSHELKEFREIKNYYNSILEEELDRTLTDSDDDSNYTSLDALSVHLAHNPVLQKVKGCTERFWDCVVIDGVINNNDRNNGNWGLLVDTSNDTYELAPVFDNGGSFNNKLSEEEFMKRLESEEAMIKSATTSATSYSINGKMIQFKELIELDYSGLKEAIRRVTPVFVSRFQSIEQMINEIPCEENGIKITSLYQKDFYIKSMKLRIERIVLPRYNNLI